MNPTKASKQKKFREVLSMASPLPTLLEHHEWSVQCLDEGCRADHVHAVHSSDIREVQSFALI